MSSPAIDRQQQVRRRFDELTASDPQLVAARPDLGVSETLAEGDKGLVESIRTVMESYADRTAVAQRSVEYVTDPATGRTSAELLPEFCTLTYRQLWGRVRTLANALAGDPVEYGDCVTVFGFNSVDYAVIGHGARGGRSGCSAATDPRAGCPVAADPR